jgi:hypothetical protein
MPKNFAIVCDYFVKSANVSKNLGFSSGFTYVCFRPEADSYIDIDSDMNLNIEHPSELRALFAAIREAKFSSSPLEDVALMTSPFLADVSHRIGKLVLLEDEKLHGKKQAQEAWTRWSRLTPERREWKMACDFASNAFLSKWSQWTLEEKEKNCRHLLSPFHATQEMLTCFVKQLDAKLE